MPYPWSLAKKVGFLFIFYYLLIYTNSSQFIFTYFIDQLWQIVVPKFANLVGYKGKIMVVSSGSGDTTYNYYQVLFFVVVASVLPILTILLDRRKWLNYDKLLYGLSVLVRYYVAMQMINYGLAKLYYMQFQYPSSIILDQELGDFSPMGLLWTFMGYSKGYTMFTGALEFIAGILLLFRRTTTLGALMTFGVMLNVMMLNYCYDVPVKLLSTHLVLMAFFLISIDGKRLLNYFILNRPVQPYVIPDIIPDTYRSAINIIKGLVITGYLGLMFFQMDVRSKQYGSKAPRPFFAEKYKIESFQRYTNGDLVADTDTSKDWKVLYHTRKKKATIRREDDILTQYKIVVDTSKQSFKLTPESDTAYYHFKYQVMETNEYRVSGHYQKDSLNFMMNKVDLKNRLLVGRAFHWINEYPLNR